MFALLQIKNEHKIYRRRRKSRLRKNLYSQIANFRNGDVNRFSSKVIRYLLKHSSTCNVQKNTIIVPNRLCFKSNFVECVNFLLMVVSTHYHANGNLVLDFSFCSEVSVSALVTLKSILEELEAFSIKVARSRYNQTPKKIKLVQSKSDKVNRHLHSLGFASFNVAKEEQREYLILGLMRGKSRNFRENRKAVVSKKVAQFVEDTAERFGVGFDERGQNFIERMVGEILSNAEDHSLKKSEWFVDGVSYLHSDKDNEVIEFNLAIINYGDSMYEGFELTKEENHLIYSKLENLYLEHQKLFTKKCSFEREPLFVLYMLNEGISRIKYLESSRGNGTMNFIKSFIDLGKFSNNDEAYKPEMNIISGHTVLSCTDEYAPFRKDSHYVLTLNKSQERSDLPDSSVLKYYNDSLFPGTILDCKIFLNKQYLDKHLSEQNNNG